MNSHMLHILQIESRVAKVGILDTKLQKFGTFRNRLASENPFGIFSIFGLILAYFR